MSEPRDASRWWAERGREAALFVRLAARRAQQDGIGLIASALAFVSILSLVPLLASFSFIGARGFTEYRQQILDLLVQVLPYSEAALQRMINDLMLQAGKVQGLGVVFFVVGALTAFSTVERTINRTWALPRRRPLRVRLLSFTLLLFWGPLLIGSAFSAAASLRQRPGLGLMLDATGIIGMLPVAALLVGLTMLYWMVPYTKVGFRNALLGGAMATLLLETLRRGFSLYIEYFPGFNLVYGSVAFVFLFMISVQIAWAIVLFGNVLAYVAQHFEALSSQRRGVRLTGPWLALAALTLLARELDRGRPIVPMAQLAARLRLTPAELRPVLGPLRRRRLLQITEGEEEGYLLARPPRRIRVSEIFDCYDPRRLRLRDLDPVAQRARGPALAALMSTGWAGPGGAVDEEASEVGPPPTGLAQAMEKVREAVTGARAEALGELTLAELAHPEDDAR